MSRWRGIRKWPLEVFNSSNRRLFLLALPLMTWYRARSTSEPTRSIFCLYSLVHGTGLFSASSQHSCWTSSRGIKKSHRGLGSPRRQSPVALGVAWSEKSTFVICQASRWCNMGCNVQYAKRKKVYNMKGTEMNENALTNTRQMCLLTSPIRLQVNSLGTEMGSFSLYIPSTSTAFGTLQVINNCLWSRMD